MGYHNTQRRKFVKKARHKVSLNKRNNDTPSERNRRKAALTRLLLDALCSAELSIRKAFGAGFPRTARRTTNNPRSVECTKRDRKKERQGCDPSTIYEGSRHDNHCKYEHHGEISRIFFTPSISRAKQIVTRTHTTRGEENRPSYIVGFPSLP